MVGEDKPSGRRFSHVYLERGDQGSDSARFRVRLAAYFAELRKRTNLEFADLIHQELGVRLRWNYGHDYSDFLDSCELKDLLDFITLIWQELDRHRYHSAKNGWIGFVNRAFEEQNIGYRADELGGVHYFVDKEFERNLASTLSALQDSRYGAVVSEVNSVFVALDKTPPDGAAAIRSVFHALEITFKLICSRSGKNVARLGAKEIGNAFKPILPGIYGTNSVALDASKLLASAFAEWVNSAHSYRHGQKTEVPVQPPLDLAIAMVSSGMSMLRWLAELDQQVSGR